MHSRLVDGDALKAEHLPATRGEILGPDGTPLVGLKPVVEVGIQPGATTDRTAAAEQVAGLVGVDAAALVDRVTKAGADDFVSVVTLRKEVYDPISGQLKAIAGTTFRESELPLAPTRDFARALIGTTGPATAEIAAASGGPHRRGRADRALRHPVRRRTRCSPARPASPCGSTPPRAAAWRPTSSRTCRRWPASRCRSPSTRPSRWRPTR